MIKKLIYLLYFTLKKEKVKNIYKFLTFFYKKDILEIGGPSRFFHKNIPIYQLASNISGVNFSSKTVWEGKINIGRKYSYFKNKRGFQYIGEAVNFNLRKKFDMIISSNCIEHIANPLLALENWVNHLDENGSLLIVAPKKSSNFDKKRPYTSFSHILNDYNKNVSESDQTHLNETIENHDFTKTNNQISKDKLMNMFKNNLKYRVIHHHVFNLNLLEKMAKFVSCKTIMSGETKKNYYILLTKK